MAKLYEISQPQYDFKTELDNLYSLEEFKAYREPFEVGNFIRVGLEIHEELYENNYVKLRLMSISYNPLENSEDLTVEFSTMTKSLSTISDLAFLLDSQNSSTSGGGSSSTSSSVGTYGNNDANVQISNNMLNALLKNESFGTTVSDVVLQTIKANKGNFNNLFANSGAFDSLEAGQIKISGDCLFDRIKSDNWNGTDDNLLENTEGSIIDLKKGNFSFAGGNLKYDKDMLTVKGNIIADSFILSDGVVVAGLASENLEDCEQLVLKDFPIGKKTDKHNSNYLNISSDGILEADNAVIHGTIYAKDGEFSGSINVNDNFVIDRNGDLISSGDFSFANGNFKYDNNELQFGFSKAVNKNVMNYDETNNVYYYIFEDYVSSAFTSVLYEFYVRYDEDLGLCCVEKAKPKISTSWKQTYGYEGYEIESLEENSTTYDFINDNIKYSILSELKQYNTYFDGDNNHYIYANNTKYRYIKTIAFDDADSTGLEYSFTLLIFNTKKDESGEPYILAIKEDLITSNGADYGMHYPDITKYIYNTVYLEDGGKYTYKLSNSGFFLGSVLSYDVENDEFILKAPSIYNNTVSGKALYINKNGEMGLSSSSKRFKNSISTDLKNVSDPHGLYDIDVVEYKYNDDYFSDKNDEGVGKTFIGLIAEDVAENFADGATYDNNGIPDGWDLRYMFPAALKLIQEQHEDIEKLKEEVEKLKNK